MKNKFLNILLFAALVTGTSCKKDNYDPPKSQLTGHIVYQGEAINVENKQVPFQLYQFGFGKVGSIDQTIAQDGSFSALLFDGEYKLIIPNGQGPFLWKYTSTGAPDSVAISMHGNQSLDLEVTPYYMIRNPQVTGTGGNVNATFKAEKIINDANGKDIERVSLFINKTQFVSGNGDQRIASTDLDGSAITDVNNIALSVAIPTITPTQNYVFARIGLKVSGVEDMIFSPVIKIDF